MYHLYMYIYTSIYMDYINISYSSWQWWAAPFVFLKEKDNVLTYNSSVSFVFGCIFTNVRPSANTKKSKIAQVEGG